MLTWNTGLMAVQIVNPLNKQDEGAQPTQAGGLSGLVRSWRYLFILIGIGVVIGLFYVEENWRGERDWAKYKRNLAARGESLDRRAFIPPAVPDSENFAVTPLLAPLFPFSVNQKQRNTNALDRVQNFAPRFDAASRAIKAPKTVRSNSWVTARANLPLWHGAFVAATARREAKAQLSSGGDSGSVQPLPLPVPADDPDPLTLATNVTAPEAATTILEALSECDPIFDELRGASRLKYSRFDLNYQEENPAAILLPHLAVLKHFCEVLQLKASAELALGRTEKAFDDVQLMLSLADATRNEPILISHFVRFSQLQLALRPLAEGMGRWSDPQLRAFQERLQRFDFCADLKFGLKAERGLLGVEIIEWVRRSPGRLNMIGSPSSGPDPTSQVLWNIVPSGWFCQEEVNYCRMFDDFLLPAIETEPRRVRPEFVKKATAGVGELFSHAGPSLFFRHRFFSAMIVPALSRVSQKAAFAQTAVDTAAIGCALERYRIARGEFPESLDRLAPDFIKELPRDMITGEPLKYRRGNGGDYLLYSVGWNETDDQGRVAENRAGEGADLDGDWVWRPVR